jgi:hypothetical protein
LTVLRSFCVFFEPTTEIKPQRGGRLIGGGPVVISRAFLAILREFKALGATKGAVLGGGGLVSTKFRGTSLGPYIEQSNQ